MGFQPLSTLPSVCIDRLNFHCIGYPRENYRIQLLIHSNVWYSSISNIWLAPSISLIIDGFWNDDSCHDQSAEGNNPGKSGSRKIPQTTSCRGRRWRI